MNSYVDDMRRELELLVKHHRDVPLPPEDTPAFQVFRAATEARDMIAVDGSYAFLLNLSSWWLALISVGRLRYAFDGRSFRRTDWRLVQRMGGVSTFEEFGAKQDDLHRALFEFTKGALQDQPRDMVNEYRRLIEGQLAINFADETEGAIVAIDGTLSEFPKQFTFMERLVALCEKLGHVLVGISKDSQLQAFGHVLTDEDLMHRAQGRRPRRDLENARTPKAERVPLVPRQSREGPAMKIGEIVAASVIDGLIAKLQLHNPEELRIAYPIIVEGARYDFYCLVEDVINEPSDIADQLAGSSISDVIVPRPETHEGYGGPIFYSKAKLRMKQLAERIA